MTPVYTVSGHRDADGSANKTACPGAALYAKLSTLRAAAKSLQGTMFYEPEDLLDLVVPRRERPDH